MLVAPVISTYFLPKQILHCVFKKFLTKNSIVKRGWKDVNDSSWTEREVMEQMGYIRLNDAGQTRWDLDIKNFLKTR